MACHHGRRFAELPSGLNNAVSVKAPLITNCATGCSRVNDIGANRSLLFGRTESIARSIKRAPGSSATTGRLQTDRHGRTAIGESERVGSLFWQRVARDEHDAAVGRLMLVLFKILRSAERSAFRWRRSGAVLDGGAKARWRGPLRRRH